MITTALIVLGVVAILAALLATPAIKAALLAWLAAP